MKTIYKAGISIFFILLLCFITHAATLRFDGNLYNDGYTISKKQGVFAYLNESTITTTTNANTWYPINGIFINEPIEDFYLNSSIPAIVYNGSETLWFEITYHIGESSDTASTTTHVSIKTDGDYNNKSRMGIFMKNINQKYTFGGILVQELIPGDAVQLMIKSDKAGADLNVRQFTTSIKRFFD